MTEPNQTPRTFISYSRQNADFALKLALELRAAGIPIWLDQLDIPTGVRWDDELENALEACEIFMVVLTPDSTSSENVKDEIGYAIDTNKLIVPVLLENARLPLRLRRFQYVDFTAMNYDEGVRAAEKMLRSLAGIEEPVHGDAALPTADEAQGTGEGFAPAQQETEEDPRIAPLLERGKNLADEGDYQQAVTMYRQVLDIDPGQIEALTLLAGAQSSLLKQQADAERRAEDLAAKLAAQKAEEERAARQKMQAAEQARAAARASQPETRPEKPSSAPAPAAAPASPSREKKPLPRGVWIGAGALGVVIISAVCVVLGINFFSGRGADPDAETAQIAEISDSTQQPDPSATSTRQPTATRAPTQAPTATALSRIQALDPEVAKQLVADGNARGVGSIARGIYTSDELASFNNRDEPIPIQLDDPTPLIVGYFAPCATSEEVLNDILSSVNFNFRVDVEGKMVPSRNIVEDVISYEDGSACRFIYIVLDSPPPGEYLIRQAFSHTEGYYDGEGNVEPDMTEDFWLVTVP